MLALPFVLSKRNIDAEKKKAQEKEVKPPFDLHT